MWDWTNNYFEFRRITEDPKELYQELEVITSELVSQNEIDVFVPDKKLIDSIMPFAGLLKKKIEAIIKEENKYFLGSEL